MKRLAFLIPLAFALPAVAQAQPGASARAQDWTGQVVATAEGGYRMGNPEAPMKLVEYGSITCSHCADFEMQQGAAIREQVRSGRVSFEYRPFVIFPSDPGIFLLLSCQAPARFFESIHTLYSTHSEWSGRLDAAEAQIQAEIARSSFGAAMPGIIRTSGTDAHFRSGGMTDRRIASCLADRARFERLAETTRQGQALGVQGTPTFFLNGQRMPASSFEDVVAAVRQQ